MARPPDPKRRQELLDGAVDYVVINGISDLSLRPLAVALGTQAPVLLHHFGTKEHLVEELLGCVRDRLRTLGRSAEAETHRSGLGAVWTWVSDPDQGPLMRLFFEAYGLALRHPDRYVDFLSHAVRDWLDEPLAAVDEISATLAIATVTGLLLDLLTTGDRIRIEDAMERFVFLIRWHADQSVSVPQQTIQDGSQTRAHRDQ
ncbi:MAG: TetR/AcrR family transcriptional regulator [Acidimicrobiales bacterium]